MHCHSRECDFHVTSLLHEHYLACLAQVKCIQEHSGRALLLCLSRTFLRCFLKNQGLALRNRLFEPGLTLLQVFFASFGSWLGLASQKEVLLLFLSLINHLVFINVVCLELLSKIKVDTQFFERRKFLFLRILRFVVSWPSADSKRVSN